MAGQAQSIQGSGDARSIAIRPLSKGMNTDLASQMLANGEGRNIAGLAVERGGLKGLPGFKPLIDNVSAVYGRIPFAFTGELIQGEHTFYTSAGAQELLMISNRGLYRSSGLLSFERVPWCRAYSKTNLVTDTLTLAGTYLLTDFVHVGMQVRLQVTATSAYEYFTIKTVTDSHTLVFTKAPTAAGYNAGVLIYEVFNVSEPYVVQFTAAPGAVYLVDYTVYGIRKYSGTYMSKLDIHNENGTDSSVNPAPFTGAATITYTQGRLRVGCTIESGAEGRKTERWSSATDLAEFSTTAYTVFSNDAGEIIKLSNLEDAPVAFLATGIYAGTPYAGDLSDTDPWTYVALETGGRNLCTPRGVASVPNGLVYIAKNDICLVTSLKRTEKGYFEVDSMDCPVLRDSLQATDHKTISVAFYDTTAEAVVFGFAATTAACFTDLWYYFTKTKAWSHRGFMPFAFTSISDIAVSAASSWNDVQALGWTWETAPDRSWRSFLADYSVSHVTAVDQTGVVYVVDEKRGYDIYANPTTLTETIYAIRHIFETGDLDFEAPDDMKVIHDFALRISGELTRVGNVDFLLEGSRDKARTWKNLGSMHLAATEDEEELHFRFSATNIRLRLSYTTTEVPFSLEELTMRIRLAGSQTVRGTD